MSGLISVEMFVALEEELYDLKEQNKLLKAENKRIINESSTKINNLEAQIRKLQSSTPNVQSAQRPGPSNVSAQVSAQIRVPVSVRDKFPPKSPSPVQGPSAIQKLPTRGPTICKLSYGHPGSMRGGVQSRGPFQTNLDVPVRKTLLVPRKSTPGPYFPGHPGSSRGGFPIRGQFPGFSTATPVRGAVPVQNMNPSRHVSSVRAVFPPSIPFQVQNVAKRQNMLPIRSLKPTVHPGSLSIIREAVPVREENQGWKFPVKNNLRPVSRTGIELETTYNQFKWAIDSSALPNKTSTQQKRTMANSSIEPPVPIKKTRQEEGEPQFVCRIDTCMYSGCIELPVFKTLDEHRHHMQNTHPERFLCKRCPFSSKLRGSIKNHEETHTNNDVESRKRQYRYGAWDTGASCTLCNIKFAFGSIRACNARLKKHNEQFH